MDIIILRTQKEKTWFRDNLVLSFRIRGDIMIDRDNKYIETTNPNAERKEKKRTPNREYQKNLRYIIDSVRAAG
jgi:hypothetical protein